MSESNYQYKESIVAFLDFLGFRQLVCQCKDGAIDIIKSIDSSINHVFETVKSETAGAVSIKLFSDCFCLSCNNSNVAEMVDALCFLQLFLAKDGIFVKGGLSKGNHFDNDRIIFSEGLINAYELQEHDKYPRVIVDDSLVQKMITESHTLAGDKITDFISIAPDGKYFLDYLHSLREGELIDEFDDLIAMHKQNIVEQVKNNYNDYIVIEKYMWLAEYHNSKFSQFYDVSGYYEDYQPQLLNEMFISSDIFPSFKMGSLNFSKIKHKAEINKPKNNN